jgi:O-antigen/teichoic acid export membrane protein
VRTDRSQRVLPGSEPGRHAKGPAVLGAAGRRFRSGTRLRIRLTGALRSHLADPLFQNAYALMVNTITTGLLGLLFWLLVARLYPAVTVGRASAGYVAMNLLAGVTALNLTGALTRFIPQAGETTRALVLRAYAVSCGASLVLAIVFWLVVRQRGASYSELQSPLAGAIFAGCVVAWSVFTLQDGVLTGLRSAIWVTVENGAFGIAKIVLLVALAAALPQLGVVTAWMVPVIVAVPLVNMLIFGRLVPRHTQLTSGRAPPTTRQVGRFLLGDYTGALCLLAIGNFIPVIVAAGIAPRTYAYFYMAWMIGGTLDLLAVNMAMSLTVEGAFDAATLAANCRAALRRTACIVVPVAGGIALLAHWVLGFYGAGYAQGGALILELLALATLPKAATELYLGALRVQSRISLIALIQGARMAVVLVLAIVFTRRFGVTGAGMAVLAGQTLIALAIVPGLHRVLVKPRDAQSAEPERASVD